MTCPDNHPHTRHCYDAHKCRCDDCKDANYRHVTETRAKKNRRPAPVVLRERPTKKCSRSDVGGEKGVGGVNWMDDAACTTTDPELFFPEKEGWASAEMAKAICDTCPVAAECLRYALDNDINEGIFGGSTARHRAALRGAA